MHLEAERYVGGWNHSKPDEKALYKKLLKSTGLDKFACDRSPSVHVSATVAYWRKANAIHNWFVQTLAGGKDECQRIYVERNKLQALSDLAGEALKYYETGEPEMACKLLPPSSGFFFGSTEIDDGYAQDLRDTIEQLAPFLNGAAKDLTFYYRASW